GPRRRAPVRDRPVAVGRRRRRAPGLRHAGRDDRLGAPLQPAAVRRAVDRRAHDGSPTRAGPGAVDGMGPGLAVRRDARVGDGRPGPRPPVGRHRPPARLRLHIGTGLVASRARRAAVAGRAVRGRRPRGRATGRPRDRRLTSTVNAMTDRQLTEFMRATMPFAVVIGAEAVSADVGEVRVRVAWDESLCTTGGALHGGLLMGLADTAGGWRAFLNLPQGAAGTTTIASNTH